VCVIPCGFACMHTNRCTPSRLAKHAHGLIIRTDLPLYLRKTHQLPHRFIPHAAPSLVPLQPPICNTCTQPRYPCELATVPSNASVDEVSLVPLQPPICESLMPLQSPICSLLFAGLSCSLSRAFAVSCLQPPICKSLLLPLSCLCSLLFVSLSCLCSLLCAASYLQVSPAPSLVPLQPPICESTAFWTRGGD